ncbi:N-6 DNA methylase [Paenibacillus sp. CF384]|uniref:N-6 DNA methylase n=1 Tax=Paenibacillus sp. CF384 TaxID=1884382 RepID=UPI000897941C|nr:N-6 DNA methylase [Paenibacillus sp. CF384]SDW71148.1 Type I restriction-modification system, DNA methylase subunit [Paenibacillus sp. CF384]
MAKNGLFYNEHFNEVENRLYYLLDIIRGNYYLFNDRNGQYTLLRLLYLKLMTKYNNEFNYTWDRVKDLNYEMFHRDDEELSRELNRLINIEERPATFNYYPIIREVINFLDNIDIPEEYFNKKLLGDLFFRFCERFFLLNKNPYSNLLSTNRIYAEVIEEIIKMKQGESILDPFIGSGGLVYNVVSANKYTDVKVYGLDIDRVQLSICSMLFELGGISHTELLNDDYFKSIHSNTKEKYDKIITHLPLRQSFSSINSSYHTKKDYMMDIVFNLINSLAINGEAYIIAPSSFQFANGEWSPIRKALINDDLLDVIIEFSELGKERSLSSLVVLVIKKRKEERRKRKIQLISLQTKNVNTLFQTMKEQEENEFSRIVSLDEVLRRGAILTFNQYDPIFEEMNRMLRFETGIYLADVANLIKPVNNSNFHFDEFGSIPVIKPSNLNKDINDIYLESNFDAFIRIEQCSETQIIDKKSIIISLQGRDLKPTIFDPNHSELKKIVLSNCVALVIKEDTNPDIDLDYIYYQLYNPKLLRQVAGYKRGSVIKRITYGDLLSIIISKPEFEKYEQLVDFQHEPIRELEKYKKLYDEAIVIREKEKVIAENNIVNMLLHNISKHISIIGHDIEILYKFLGENNLLEKVYNIDFINEHNDSFQVRNGLEKAIELVPVDKIVNRTKERINLLEKIFEDTQKSINLNLNGFDFEIVSVKQLLLDLTRDRLLNKDLEYKFIVEGDDAKLRVNIPSFKELFHLLINNAEEHSFENQIQNSSFIIEFKIIKRKNSIIIEYKNNGLAFNITQVDFILAGKKNLQSSGSGLGGAYINRVVLKHNGSFVIEPQDKGVKFIFTFNMEARKNDDNN